MTINEMKQYLVLYLRVERKKERLMASVKESGVH